MGIESKLRELVRIHDECYDRNENPVPEYDGPEIVSSIYNCGSIKSNLNGEEYERHLKNGRTLTDALLSSAYNLGMDSILYGESMMMKDQIIEAQKLVIKTLQEKLKTENK